jgi:hypothetical protein
MRCGIIVARYKGPVVTPPAFAAPPVYGGPPPLPSRSSPPPLPPRIPPPPVIAGGTVLPPPLPVPSPGGPFPGDPPPESVSGTLYQGPPPGSVAPVFSSFPATAGPAFLGTFEPGKILGETFSIYFSNIIPFLLLSVLALSPLLLFAAWMSSLPATEMVVQLSGLLGNLIQLICVPIATAAITYGVYQQMRGGTTSLVACLQVGLTTLFPMLGLAFVQGFAIGLGTLACVVPGILLAVRWAVSIPAKVEERPSITDAMKRSSYLTEGYRWQVFAVLAVLFVINLVLGMGAGVVVGVSSVRSGKTMHPGTLLFMTSLVQVVTTGIAATASAVMYYRLRSVKESVDVDQISSVFA